MTRTYRAKISLLPLGASNRSKPLPHGQFSVRIRIDGQTDRAFRARYRGGISPGTSGDARIVFPSDEAEAQISVAAEYDIMEIGKIGVLTILGVLDG